MRLRLFFLIALITVFSAKAQMPSKNKIAAVEALIDSAYDKTLVVDMRGSGLYAQKALKLSRQYNYKAGEAWSNFYIGQGLFELLAYKQSLDYLDKAENLNKELKDSFLSYEIYRVRGRVFGSLDMYDAALKEQKKGLSIISTIPKSQEKKDYLTSLVYENIAVNYSKVGDHDSFYYYLNKNENLLEKQDPSFVFLNSITLYTMLGAYYTDVNNFTKAEESFVKSVSISEKYNYSFISFTYQCWGALEIKKHNPTLAVSYLEKSLAILEKTNFRNEIPDVYAKMAIAYQEMGQEQKSKDYKLKALELQNELKTQQLKASSLAVEDILKFQLEEETSEHSRNKIFLITLIVIAIILIFVLFVKYFNVKRLKSQKKVIIKQKEEEIKSKERQITELNHKVNQSFEEVIALAKANNSEFYTRFQEVYPEVVTKVLEICPNLRISELTLSAYIFLGFTTKDISASTFTSVNTVKVRKYNLRKKLNIPAEMTTDMWFKNLSNRE